VITRITWTLLACALFAATGCNKAEPTKSDQKPKADDTNAAKKTPDSNLRHDLTKEGDVDKYQISLPKDFADLPAPKNLPPFVKTYTWQGPSVQNIPSGIITITVITQEKAVDEAKQNVRQFLVNFSAGVTESSGIKIAQRGPTEQFTFNGIAFSRFKWTGTAQNQKPVTGFAYGAIIGTDVVAITTLHIDPAKAAATADLMENIIATFKKK
jgi:hypothetical protein